VMLTKTDLFVQGELIESIKDVQANQGPTLAPLSAALKGPLLVGRDVSEAALAAREITIMADKSLSYEILKKVMATCTDADYGKISLAVLQKEKPVTLGRAPAA
jgi:biopolymer transport protein TolR